MTQSYLVKQWIKGLVSKETVMLHNGGEGGGGERSTKVRTSQLS